MTPAGGSVDLFRHLRPKSMFVRSPFLAPSDIGSTWPRFRIRVYADLGINTYPEPRPDRCGNYPTHVRPLRQFSARRGYRAHLRHGEPAANIAPSGRGARRTCKRPVGCGYRPSRGQLEQPGLQGSGSQTAMARSARWARYCGPYGAPAAVSWPSGWWPGRYLHLGPAPPSGAAQPAGGPIPSLRGG